MKESNNTLNNFREKEGDTSNSTNENFFLNRTVEISRYEPIAVRFETLINANCEAPFDWYKDLGLDKSYASKVRRGLIIPPTWLRIKIAQYFKTDSSTIWKTTDLPYIKEALKKQSKGQELILPEPEEDDDGRNSKT